MMKNGFKALVATLSLSAAPAFADSAPTADPPLVVNGDLRLSTSDFMAYTKIIPEDNRTDFLTSLDKITRTVDGLWVRRMLAEKARRAGLAEDPEVIARIHQSTDAILADRYMEREVVAKIVLPDLQKRALEIYKADPKRFTVGETLNVQHILVGLKGRTREAAAERAAEAYQQATKGSKEFLDYARLYSDDPDLAKNYGDLGYRTPGSFTEATWGAISKMKVGEISKPLETERGFHIFKMIDHRPERIRPFVEVKDKIVADEALKIVNAKREEVVDAVRTDPNNSVNMDNIRKLQVKVDIKALPRTEATRP
jgi:PPIC-type peptidyl-prolyl cis-trans isomerase-like protein